MKKFIGSVSVMLTVLPGLRAQTPPAAPAVPQRAVATASFSQNAPGNPLSAMNDGQEPISSGDASMPFSSFQPATGSLEWAQYDFETIQSFGGCAVYWKEDLAPPASRKPSGKNGTALPIWWKVLYQNDAGDWLPVSGKPPAPSSNAWNVCHFKAVRTKSLRLAVQQTFEGSAGILEWKVIPAAMEASAEATSLEEIGLDDLIPFSAKVGSGQYRVNKYSTTEEQRGHRVLVDGAPCSRFLFSHANSALTFVVPSGFTRFTAVGIGPTGAGWSNYSWTYQILADGRPLYKSEQLDSYPGRQVKIETELPPGTKTITLVTDGAGNLAADHSIWAEPKLQPPPVSPETKAKLSQLETQYQAARVKALAPLRQSYLAAVKRALETARKDFDADAMPALEAEIRLVTAGQAMPPVDDAGTPPGLGKLRATYRTAVKAAEANAASPVAVVQDRYDAALAELSGSLAHNPADAAAVAEVRTRLRAGRAAELASLPPVAPTTLPPATPAKTAAPVPVVTTSSMARLRQLAEKVITLNPNGLRLIVERQVMAPTKLPLPGGAFEIQEIGLAGPNVKSFTDADLDLLASGRSAIVLTFNDTSITRLDGLKPHAGLRILAVNGSPLPDDALKPLDGMRSLEQLHLNGTKISGSGLVALSGCSKLSFLSLWGTQVGDSSLIHLGRLRSLTRLNIGNTKVTGSGLANLAGLSNLVYLGLDGLALTPGSLDGLRELKRLTEIDLNSAKLDSPLLALVGSLSGLEILLMGNMSVNGTLLSDADLRELSGLSKLKELHLTYSGVTGTGLSALAKAKNLEKLVLGHTTPLTDEGLLVAVRTFPSLTSLTAGGIITATSLGSLGQLTKLKSLLLNGPELTDAGVNALPPLRNLESLELHSPKLTSAISTAVARQPKLIRLHLNGTAVDDTAIPDLCRMKGLKELNLSGLSISPANLDKLRKSLPACQVIR